MNDLAKDIQAIVDQRKALLDTTPDHPMVDLMSKSVQALLAKFQDELPVDFILETLTMLGAAPSLLYDDDGHWTVGGDGVQPIMAFADRTKETEFSATWWVEPNGWKRTIREAIRDYLSERT